MFIKIAIILLKGHFIFVVTNHSVEAFLVRSDKFLESQRLKLIIVSGQLHDSDAFFILRSIDIHFFVLLK